jgi:phospholipase/lecithinase/hemolysin
VKTLRRIIACAFLLLVGAVSALAGPYSELIVFGDSLSDVGNVKQSSLGLFPVNTYYHGRFSNGLVYIDFGLHLD